LNNTKILFATSLLAMFFSGCNTYADSGKATKSSMAGYKQYTNKTINVSVLVPEGWTTRVNVGGEFVMTSPAAALVENRRPSITISSSPMNALSKMGVPSSIDGTAEAYKNSRLPLSTTLEAFKNNRLAFLTEKNVGPQFRKSVKKSKLAGYDAYEISFSYKIKEFPQRLMVQETFTLVNGKVYRVLYYADEDVYSKYLNELQTVKKSYRILK